MRTDGWMQQANRCFFATARTSLKIECRKPRNQTRLIDSTAVMSVTQSAVETQLLHQEVINDFEAF